MKKLIFIASITILLAASACGTLNATVSLPAATSVSPTNAPTAAPTQIPANTPESPTATSQPPTETPLTPTDTAAAPTATKTTSVTQVTPIDVKVEAGTTNINENGRFDKYTRITYALKIIGGQYLAVNLHSGTEKVALEIADPGGNLLVQADQQVKSWQGDLNASGKYLINVISQDEPSKYNLNIVLPTRINYGVDTSLAISGQVQPGGYSNYIMKADKDKTMTIQLSSSSKDVFVELYGISSGQYYVNSKARTTSFTFKVPSTQDYMINLFSTNSSLENYNMTITMK